MCSASRVRIIVSLLTNTTLAQLVLLAHHLSQRLSIRLLSKLTIMGFDVLLLEECTTEYRIMNDDERPKTFGCRICIVYV